jgi:hypothetical protein
MRAVLVSVLAICAAACGAQQGVDGQSAGNGDPAELTATGALGSVPVGLPAHLGVGLAEQNGQSWMKSSGVAWDYRYMYLTKGWSNNWGWGALDGSFALGYMNDAAASGFTPVLTYYQVNGEAGGGEAQFLAKVQNATTMKGYFSDFKLLMQQAKNFGKPVIVHVEPDGFGFLEQQSGGNPNAAAAVASTGLPELSGLPNTVAGWGLAFLQLRKAAGANNVVLAIHVSSWATGVEFATHSVTNALQPIVDQAYGFLGPMGVTANVTGATYDLLAGDPLDRDADYYVTTGGGNPWWDPSDTASISSASFNRYAEWLRLWNQTSGKRWMLWQIPIGNSNHLNVYNNGGPRQGYRDNRVEYFFGSGLAHAQKFASVGVVALLFGPGASGQSSYANDTWTDGSLFLSGHVKSFYAAGGISLSGSTAPPPGDAGTPLPADAGTPPPPADGGTSAATPAFTATGAVSPASLAPGGTATFTATITDTGGALTNGVVDLEVYDPTGAKVAQQASTGQSFSAGQTRTFTWAWTAPATAAAGTYQLAVGMFGANWSPMYSWTSAAASLTVAAGDAAQYGFESGTQGWVSGGAPISGVSSSTAQHFAGAHALAVSLSGASGSQTVKVASPAVAAGKLVTFHVWIPSGNAISAVQPYVLQGAGGGWAWTGNWQAASALKAGAWNTLTVQVPANAAALAELGVQFSANKGAATTAYVDSVSW